MDKENQIHNSEEAGMIDPNAWVDRLDGHIVNHLLQYWKQMDETLGNRVYARWQEISRLEQEQWKRDHPHGNYI